MTFAKGTDKASCHHRAWLWDLLLITVWMVFFIFSLEHTATFLPRKILNTLFYDYNICFYSESSAQMAQGTEKLKPLLDKVNIMLLLCIIKL